MSVLTDEKLIGLNTSMIIPFMDEQVREAYDGGRVISYGVSSVGYDICVGEDVQVIKESCEIDPKHFDDSCLEKLELNITTDGAYVLLPPHSTALAYSVERFTMPCDVMAICVGKSTYARCGLLVNVTPIEPEWEGHLTLELSNMASSPIRVYVNEGIAQLIFHELESTPLVTYNDRRGKYQNQPARIVPARV